MQHKIGVSVAIVGAFLAGTTMVGVADADFNPRQVCLGGTADAKFALQNYRDITHHYQRADRRLERSADHHNGRPTKRALGVWAYQSHQANRAAAQISVRPIVQDLEWCTNG